MLRLFICCYAIGARTLSKAIPSDTAMEKKENRTPKVHYSTVQKSSSEIAFPNFPEAISPRKKNIPVKNRFEVLNLREHGKLLGLPDFFIVAYYRGDNLCDLTIRRLDELKWNFDIKLKLYAVPASTIQTAAVHVGHMKGSRRLLSSGAGGAEANMNNNSTLTSVGIKEGVQVLSDVDSEIITIGPSNSSFIHMKLQTKVKLVPLTNAELYPPQKIPRIIMQTYYTLNATNIYHWNAFQTFVELNPEYEVLIMLDKHCRVFIKNHFPANVLRAYDTLVPKAFKADLFRYCYLYIKGGCYFDNKMINRTPLRRTILPDDEFLVCSDTLFWGIPAKTLKETKKFYNAVICSAPRDERMLRTIRAVVFAVNNRDYKFSDLAITGPVAFYEATKDLVDESNLRFQHEMGRHPFKLPWSPEGHNLGRQYRDYFVREKTNGEIMLVKFFQGYYSTALRRYGDLWNQGKAYYEHEVYKWDDYRLFVEPGILPYYSVNIDEEGVITVEERSLWRFNIRLVPWIVEEGKRFIREKIIRYGNGGLTDKLEFKLVNDETSDEHYLSLEYPSKRKPKVVFDVRKELKLS